MGNGNLPAAKFRIGYVSVTVWKNDGYYNVDLSRSYKDKNDEWQETSQLGHGDLLNAAQLLRRAEDFIAKAAK